MTILFPKTMFKTNKTVHKRTVFATENKGKQAIPKIWLGKRVIVLTLSIIELMNKEM